MKSKFLPLAAAVTLTFSLALPHAGSAGKSDDIKGLRQEVKEKQEAQKKVKRQMEENKREQHSVQSRLDELNAELEETKQEIRRLNDEIHNTENELETAKEKLQEAEERVAKRDKLFKERIRLMYEKGNVTYLEVLFGAKDFSDFLARFESIQVIMKQDRELLVAQKRDRDVIAESKRTIEVALDKLNSLQAEAEEQRNILAQQQKEQELALAGLQKEYDELEDINEEEAQKERELAAKLAAAIEAEEQKKKAARAAAATGGGSSGGGGGGGGGTFRDSGGTLAWPANGTLTSGFGPRWGRQHNGIDISAPGGTPIYAAADGQVVKASYGWNGGYGNQVIIVHSGGISTMYAHIRNGGIQVSPGQTVKRGQKIAEVGNTGSVKGRNGGYHLHFEVWEGSSPVNPMKYLR